MTIERGQIDVGQNDIRAELLERRPQLRFSLNPAGVVAFAGSLQYAERKLRVMIRILDQENTNCRRRYGRLGARLRLAYALGIRHRT